MGPLFLPRYTSHLCTVVDPLRLGGGQQQIALLSQGTQSQSEAGYVPCEWAAPVGRALCKS